MNAQLLCHVSSSLSCVQLFVIPWALARQAPLSMEFSKQEYWNGLPYPLPRDLTDSEIESEALASHELAGRLFTTAALGTPVHFGVVFKVWTLTQVVLLI